MRHEQLDLYLKRPTLYRNKEKEGMGGTYPGYYSSCCNVSCEDSQKKDRTERKADTHCVD